MGIKDFLISCIFPKRCAVCDEVIDYNNEICDECINELKSENLVREIDYIKGNKTYNCFSPFRYDGKIREIILKFKFRNHKKCVDFFVKEMAKSIYTFCDVKDIDYICFVPMTARSIEERGYNQSEILAESLSKVMKIPVKDVMVKIRETPAQHNLSAKDRERNLVSAFSLSKDADIRGKNFILCDDIVTTGSTLRECLKVLKNGGANEVICCTIATSHMD